MGERLKIRYENEAGHFVELTDHAPFVYLSHQGLDGANAQAILSKAPYQMGKTLQGVNVDERLVTLECALITEDAATNETYRRKLFQAFSPFVDGTLTLIGNTYQMSALCRTTQVPSFKDEDYTDFQVIMMFQVQLIVPSNFLEGLEQTVKLERVSNLFKFPHRFKKSKEAISSLNIGGQRVINDGDGETALVIEIIGPTTTPRVENLTTGEFIAVNTPLLAGERLLINTAFGNISVKIINEKNEVRDAFQMIDIDSTFFSLQIGENKLHFSAEVGNESAVVNIRYKKKYLGI